jgi:hypothetical protein
MNKETFYFPHDYNSRTDPKIKKLLAKHGVAGYGIFWCLIEDLYNNANALPSDCDSIAYDLHTQSETIKSIIYDFDLFEINDKYFSSSSVHRRLNDRNSKSEKARESANYRWKNKYNDANALRSQCDSNAIKEKKRKKRKDIRDNITTNNNTTIINRENNIDNKEKKEKEKEKENFVSQKSETPPKKTLHQKIIEIHNDFYLKTVTVPYKFAGGADGAAVKEIINYLKKVVGEKKKTANDSETTDVDIENSFRYIFANYDMWENFYKKQLKLSQINSNLPNIIANIKNPISNRQTVTDSITKLQKQLISEINEEELSKQFINENNNNLKQIENGN